MTVRVGINGFGRIGRNVFCVGRDRQNFWGNDIEIVAHQRPARARSTWPTMLRYDSVHGRFKADVKVEGNTLIANGKKIVKSSPSATRPT